MKTLSITLPSGWSVVTTSGSSNPCTITWLSTTGFDGASAVESCSASTNSVEIVIRNNGASLGRNFSVTFAANSLNVLSTRDFTLLGTSLQSDTYTGTATLPASSGGGGGGSAPSASLSLAVTQGQLVAGSSVGIVASGLQPTAPYTVVVRSTPQTIGTGNAVNGAVNTSVTLPSGLGAGWHSLTFNSTAVDGSAVTSVLYFEVSASGTLLATSSTEPAALANTGFDGVPYLAGGLSLAVVGGSLMLIARRRALQ